MKKRPFGVTLLAVLAGALAVLSGIHALQALGLLPFVIGTFKVHAFSFWSFLMWLMMVWVYVWLVQMLWQMNKQAWLFLAVITVFNLILGFTVSLGEGEFSDSGISFILNVLILIYIMLPGVRKSFEAE